MMPPNQDIADRDTAINTAVNPAINLDPINFPLHGCRLIEASAGTGKTYTLAALYVRLILQHGGSDGFSRPLLPPEILVVTFTEAATRELRDRIRARLAGAARCFRGTALPAADDDFLLRLMADYPPEQHPACADLLNAAAQWMDEAAVYTIHGFANRMLKQHAFDSGSLFQLQLSEQEPTLQLDATRDYWRTFCVPLSADDALALAEVYSGPDTLLSAVKPLLGAEALIADAQQPPQVMLAQVQAESKQLVRDWKARWLELEPDLSSELESAWQNERLSRKKPSTDKKIREWLGQITTWARDPDLLELELTPTAKKNLTAEALAPHGDGIDSILNHAAWSVLPRLQKIKDELPKLSHVLLPHAAVWIRERVRQQKERLALISFDDMLTNLRTALADQEQGPSLAEKIRRQFPVALIDEFQDTDPIQYDAFQRIYAAHSASTGWFMIGDPKQAIYGFRGADIFTYLQARQFTRGAHYTLGTNFRSVPTLVSAINHVFDRPKELPQGAFLMGSEIPFLPVASSAKSKQLIIADTDSSGLALWLLSAPDKAGVSITKSDYVSRMARVCASEIARLLQLAQQGQAGIRDTDAPNTELKALRPADIAILVRTGREASTLRAALQELGLRSVYLSDQDSVFASPEATDLLGWLRACAEPDSEPLLRAALASATLAQSWQALEQWCTDESAWELLIEDFRQFHRIWQRRGVLPMVRALLRRFAVPERLLAEANDRALTNLLQLAELLQTAASSQDGEHALIRWLNDAISDSQSDNNAGAGASEAHILRLESDADLIKVVTIHKSKGLQYPLVFLPFVCAFRAVKETDLPIRYHNAAGERQLSLEADANILQAAEHERLGEDLRLLYVALTRAQYRCWVGLAPMRVGTRDETITHLHQSAIGYLLAGGKSIAPTALADYVSAWQQHPGITLIADPPETAETFADPPTDTLSADPLTYSGLPLERWWIASYSALRHDSSRTQSGAPDRPPADPVSHRESVIVDENIDQNIAENITHSTAQDITQDITQHITQDTTQDVAQNTAQDIAQDTAQDIAQDTAQDIAQDVAQDVAQNIAHSIAQDIAQDSTANSRGKMSRFQPGPRFGVHGFVRGPLAGTFLHGVLEQAANVGFAASLEPGRDGLAEWIKQRSPLRGWGDQNDWVPVLTRWFTDVLTVEWPFGTTGVALNQLSPGHYRAELEFMLEARQVSSQDLDDLVRHSIVPGAQRPRLVNEHLHGMLRGFIDLVFTYQGRYYLADYKSTWLGNNDQAYHLDALQQVALEHRQDVQLSLYTLALHRLLRARLGAAYDPNRHLGGSALLYLRGIYSATRGVWFQPPDPALIDALDALFADRSLAHA